MKKKVKFVCPDCGGRLAVVEGVVFEASKRILQDGCLSKKRELFETIDSTGECIRCEECRAEFEPACDIFNTFINKEQIEEIYDEIKFEKEKN